MFADAIESDYEIELNDTSRQEHQAPAAAAVAVQAFTVVFLTACRSSTKIIGVQRRAKLDALDTGANCSWVT
jgi:hypothetical protein